MRGNVAAAERSEVITPSETNRAICRPTCVTPGERDPPRVHPDSVALDPFCFFLSFDTPDLGATPSFCYTKRSMKLSHIPAGMKRVLRARDRDRETLCDDDGFFFPFSLESRSNGQAVAKEQR